MSDGAEVSASTLVSQGGDAIINAVESVHLIDGSLTVEATQGGTAGSLAIKHWTIND